MKHLLVIAHSPSPNTERLKNALLGGIDGSLDLSTKVLSPFEANTSHVQEADGIILFTTENFGYMSGALKDFFDRTYYPVLDTKRGTPYALVIRAGKDGTGAKRATESIIKGLGWKKVQETIVLKGPYREDFETEVRDLTEAFSMALNDGII